MCLLEGHLRPRPRPGAFALGRASSKPQGRLGNPAHGSRVPLSCGPPHAAVSLRVLGSANGPLIPHPLSPCGPLQAQICRCRTSGSTAGPGGRVALCVSLTSLLALARCSSRRAGRLHDIGGGLGLLGSWARLVSPLTLSRRRDCSQRPAGAQQRRCDRFALGSRPRPMKKPALVGAGKDNWRNRQLSWCSKRRRRCSPVARQSPCCRGTRRRQHHRNRRARSRWRTPPSLPW